MKKIQRYTMHEMGGTILNEIGVRNDCGRMQASQVGQCFVADIAYFFAPLGWAKIICFDK